MIFLDLHHRPGNWEYIPNNRKLCQNSSGRIPYINHLPQLKTWQKNISKNRLRQEHTLPDKTRTKASNQGLVQLPSAAPRHRNRWCFWVGKFRTIKWDPFSFDVFLFGDFFGLLGHVFHPVTWICLAFFASTLNPPPKNGWHLMIFNDPLNYCIPQKMSRQCGPRTITCTSLIPIKKLWFA